MRKSTIPVVAVLAVAPGVAMAASPLTAAELNENASKAISESINAVKGVDVAIREAYMLELSKLQKEVNDAFAAYNTADEAAATAATAASTAETAYNAAKEAYDEAVKEGSTATDEEKAAAKKAMEEAKETSDKATEAKTKADSDKAAAYEKLAGVNTKVTGNTEESAGAIEAAALAANEPYAKFREFRKQYNELAAKYTEKGVEATKELNDAKALLFPADEAKADDVNAAVAGGEAALKAAADALDAALDAAANTAAYNEVLGAYNALHEKWLKTVEAINAPDGAYKDLKAEDNADLAELDEKMTALSNSIDELGEAVAAVENAGAVKAEEELLAQAELLNGGINNIVTLATDAVAQYQAMKTVAEAVAEARKEYQADIQDLIKNVGDSEIFAAAEPQMTAQLKAIKDVEDANSESYTKRPVRESVEKKNEYLAQLNGIKTEMTNIVNKFVAANSVLVDLEAKYASYNKNGNERVSKFVSFSEPYAAIRKAIDVLTADVLAAENPQEVAFGTAKKDIEASFSALDANVETILDILDNYDAKGEMITAMQSKLDEVTKAIQALKTSGITKTTDSHEENAKVVIEAYDAETLYGNSIQAADAKLNSKGGVAEEELGVAVALDQALAKDMEAKEIEASEVAAVTVNKDAYIANVTKLGDSAKATYNKFVTIKAAASAYEKAWAEVMPAVSKTDGYKDGGKTLANDDTPMYAIYDAAKAVRARINKLEAAVNDAILLSESENMGAALDAEHYAKMIDIDLDEALSKDIEALKKQAEDDQVLFDYNQAVDARAAMIKQAVTALGNVGFDSETDAPVNSREDNKGVGVKYEDLKKVYDKVNEDFATVQGEVGAKQSIAGNTLKIEQLREDITILTKVLSEIEGLKKDADAYKADVKKAQDAVVADNKAYKDNYEKLAGFLDELNDLTPTVMKGINPVVLALFNDTIAKAQVKIEGYVTELGSNAAPFTGLYLKQDCANEEFAKKLEAFVIELAGIKDDIFTAQDNWIAHQDLIALVGTDKKSEQGKYMDESLIEDSVADQLNKVDASHLLPVYQEQVAAQIAALDKIIEENLTEFTLKCDCAAKQENLTKEINAIPKKVEEILDNAEKNDKAHEASVALIDEAQETWNKTYDWLVDAQNGDYTHSEILADYLKEMAKLQLQHNELVESVEEAWENGTATDQKIDENINAYIKYLNEIPGKITGDYSEAVAIDNDARYNKFLKEHKNTTDAFEAAIVKVDDLRHIDVENDYPEAQAIVDAANAVHDELFKMSQDIVALKADATLEYRQVVSPEFFDIEEQNYAKAQEWAVAIEDKMDAFYDSVDAVATDLINKAYEAIDPTIFAAGDKLNGLDLTEEELTHIFDNVWDYANDATVIGGEQHSSEVLVETLDKLTNGVANEINKSIDHAAAIDLTKAIEAAKADYAAALALVEEDGEYADYAESVKEEYVGALGAVDAQIYAANEYLTDEAGLYDILDEAKELLSGIPTIIDEAKAAAEKAQNAIDSDQANNHNYETLMALAGQYKMAVDGVSKDIEAYPYVAEKYAEDLTRHQNQAAAVEGQLAEYKTAGALANVEFAEMLADRYTDWTEAVNALLENAPAQQKAIYDELKATADSDIQVLEELYNKVLVAQKWEDPEDYKGQIDGIKTAVAGSVAVAEGTEEVDPDTKTAIDTLNEQHKVIATLTTDLTEILNEGAAAAAKAEVEKAIAAVNDKLGAISYRDEVYADKNFAEKLAAAKAAIEDVTIDDATVTYDKDALLAAVKVADGLADAAIEAGDAVQEKYDTNDANYAANNKILDQLEQDYNDLAETIGTYLPNVQEGVKEEMDAIGELIKAQKEENEAGYNNIACQPVLDWRVEIINESLENTGKKAAEQQKIWANEGAYARFVEAYYSDAEAFLTGRTGVYYQYSNLLQKIKDNYDHLYIEDEKTDTDLVLMSEIEDNLYELAEAIQETYDEKTLPQNEADFVEYLAGIQKKVDAVSDNINARLGYWDQIHNNLLGDVNMDGSIDVIDYAKVANMILNNIQEDEVDKATWYLADANADNRLNASDLSTIINKIKAEYKTRAKAVGEAASAANDYVTVDVENDNLAIGVENAVAYIGFQMDITLPSGASINDMQLTSRCNGQEIAFANIGGDTYRVLVMGINGSAFSANSGALFTANLNNMHGTVAINNIVFTDAAANSYELKLAGEATAIEGVEAQQTTVEKIYSVGGQLMGKMKKGINVIKGAKFLGK